MSTHKTVNHTLFTYTNGVFVTEASDLLFGRLTDLPTFISIVGKERSIKFMLEKVHFHLGEIVFWEYKPLPVLYCASNGPNVPDVSIKVFND